MFVYVLFIPFKITWQLGTLRNRSRWPGCTPGDEQESMDSLETHPLIVYSVCIGTKDKRQAAEKRKSAPCPSFVSVVGSYLGEDVCSPSLWRRQGRCFKQLVMWHPQSRAERNACVHARLLARLHSTLYLHSHKTKDLCLDNGANRSRLGLPKPMKTISYGHVYRLTQQRWSFKETSQVVLGCDNLIIKANHDTLWASHDNGRVPAVP